MLQVIGKKDGLAVWDTATGAELWSFKTANANDNVGAFTPDGQQVVTYGSRRKLRILDAKDGTLIRTLGGASTILTTLVVQPSGKTMITAARDGTVRGFNLQDGQTIFEFRLPNRVEQMAFAPDGGRFVTMAPLKDGRQSLQLWGANTGGFLQSLLGASGAVRSVSVHPISGELIVSGPSARARNLTGKVERWKLSGDKPGDIGFWGSDNLFFGSVGKLSIGLIASRASLRNRM